MLRKYENRPDQNYLFTMYACPKNMGQATPGSLQTYNILAAYNVNL